MSIHWNWRLASRLSVIILAVLVVILVTLLQQRNQAATIQSTSPATTASGLQGTDLDGAAAANFSLTDQYGKQVSLAQYKGKPVVLTFLYTNCPDVCPLTAEKLHATMQMLGQDAQNVGVIAVSTDPARDTQTAALNFSKTHNMQDSWHYLVGTEKQLSSVWSDYHIFAQQNQQQVNHSMGIYVIDKQGHQQVYEDNDFTPAQLAANLKILLNQ